MSPITSATSRPLCVVHLLSPNLDIAKPVCRLGRYSREERPVTCSRGSARSAGAKFLLPITSAPIVPRRRHNPPRPRRNLRRPIRRSHRLMRRNRRLSPRRPLPIHRSRQPLCRRLPRPSTSAQTVVSRNVRQAASARTVARHCPSLRIHLSHRPTLRLPRRPRRHLLHLRQWPTVRQPHRLRRPPPYLRLRPHRLRPRNPRPYPHPNSGRSPQLPRRAEPCPPGCWQFYSR